MNHSEEVGGLRPESRGTERTQEVIATLNVAASELVRRIVEAERDVHDQRNAAFHAMNKAALPGDDVERLRAVLGAARTLVEAAGDECPSAALRADLTRGLTLIDDVLEETAGDGDGA